MAVITRDGELIINVDGVEVDRLRSADFDSALDDRQLEAALKTRVESEAETKLPPEKRPTILIHIFDRAGRNYVIGTRPPGWALSEAAVKLGLNWWEVPPYSNGAPREVRR